MSQTSSISCYALAIPLSLARDSVQWKGARSYLRKKNSSIYILNHVNSHSPFEDLEFLTTWGPDDECRCTENCIVCGLSFSHIRKALIHSTHAEAIPRHRTYIHSMRAELRKEARIKLHQMLITAYELKRGLKRGFQEAEKELRPPSKHNGIHQGDIAAQPFGDVSRDGSMFLMRLIIISNAKSSTRRFRFNEPITRTRSICGSYT